METVWAVTTGEYSDYSVRCLFTTKKAAEQHARDLRGDEGGWHRDATVEPFHLLDAPPEKVTLYTRRAAFDPDGRETTVRLLGRTEADEDYWPVGDLWGAARPVMEARTYSPPIDQGQAVRVEVRGTDRKRVEKAFSERVAKAKALGLAAVDQ